MALFFGVMVTIFQQILSIKAKKAPLSWTGDGRGKLVFDKTCRELSFQ